MNKKKDTPSMANAPVSDDRTRPMFAVVRQSPDLATSVAYAYGRKHAEEMAQFMAAEYGGAWRLFKSEPGT